MNYDCSAVSSNLVKWLSSSDCSLRICAQIRAQYTKVEKWGPVLHPATSIMSRYILIFFRKKLAIGT